VRSFSSGFAALYDQNLDPTLAQGNRQREADDPAADNNYVPCFHFAIVEDGASKIPSEGDDNAGITA
jgi:hypothetical protein